MCKSLKFGKDIKTKGNRVRVTNTRNKTSTKLIWAGHAKKEYIKWWRDYSKFDMVSIKADSFEENGVQFKLDEESWIYGIQLGKDVEINGKIIGREGELFLLTREARTKTEKKVHDRWPLVFSKDDPEMRLFESEDITGDNNDGQSEDET